MHRTSPSSFQHQESKTWSQFFSGLMAGFISVTVCNPLDITRTRLNILNSPNHKQNQGKYNHFSHAMRTIWKQEGWRGFYGGYRTNVVAISIFHSLYFPIYQKLKGAMIERKFSLFQSTMGASSISGILINILTNPIWVVRTRLMTQYLHHKDNHYKTQAPFEIIKDIYQKEGFQSLFKGLIPSLFAVSNAMINFSIYQQLKERVGVSHWWITGLTSAVSKAIASTITYPLVVMRTVMFDCRQRNTALSMVEISRYIMRKRGFFGFYAGLKPDLIRLVPSNAITFMVYQAMRKHL